MLKVKTRLINAEGQNNIYKKIKDMLKVRKDTFSSDTFSKTPLVLVRCKAKGEG